MCFTGMPKKKHIGSQKKHSLKGLIRIISFLLYDLSFTKQKESSLSESIMKHFYFYKCTVNVHFKHVFI